MASAVKKTVPQVTQTRPKFSTVLWENRHVIIAVSVGTVAVVAGVVACLIFIPGAPLAAFGAIAVGAIFGKLGLCSFIAASAGLGALSVIGASGLAALPVLICRATLNKAVVSELLNEMRKNKNKTMYFFKSLSGDEESKTKLHKKVFENIELFIKNIQLKSINDEDIIDLLSIALDTSNLKEFPELFMIDPEFEQVACHSEDCKTLRKALFDFVTIDFIEEEKKEGFDTDSSLKAIPLGEFLADMFPTYSERLLLNYTRISKKFSQFQLITEQCKTDKELTDLALKYILSGAPPSRESLSLLIEFIKYIRNNNLSTFTEKPDKCSEILYYSQKLDIGKNDQTSINKFKKMIDFLFNHKDIDVHSILQPFVFQFILTDIDPSFESITSLISSIRYIKKTYPNLFNENPILYNSILVEIQRNPPTTEQLPEIIDKLVSPE